MSRIARISRRARVLTLLLGLGMLAGVLAPAPAARAADAAVAEPAWRVLDSTATTLRLELTIPGYERRAVGDAANRQAVALLVPHLRSETVDEWIAAATHKSESEIISLLTEKAVG